VELRPAPQGESNELMHMRGGRGGAHQSIVSCVGGGSWCSLGEYC
jgi:hypothetical protein